MFLFLVNIRVDQDIQLFTLKMVFLKYPHQKERGDKWLRHK